MISDEQLLPRIIDAGEGDLIMAGNPLPGLSPDKMAWVVQESIHLHNRTRITLHGYWHDVFVVSKVVNIYDGTRIEWGETKV